MKIATISLTFALAASAPFIASASDSPRRGSEWQLNPGRMSPHAQMIRRPSGMSPSADTDLPYLPSASPRVPASPSFSFDESAPRPSSARPHPHPARSFRDAQSSIPVPPGPASNLQPLDARQVEAFKHIYIMECGDFYCSDCNRVFRNTHKHD